MLQINYPTIALSPMDGITDAAYRYMANTIGKPDITFTEFVHVIGICRGGERLWQDFIFDECERPVVAQLFGAEPEYFYHAAKIACELGFDGIDINMGCPAKNVTEHGAGAALIRTPKLAQEIILATQRGVKDWYETGELTGIDAEHIDRISTMQLARKAKADTLIDNTKPDRQMIPVSVKTRIGYDKVVITEWVSQLAETNPAWISIHGRTLKQMYTGAADWEAVATGVQVLEKRIPALANGDIKTHADVKKALATTGANGVLIGRGTYGNPWWFKGVAELKQAILTNQEPPAMYAPSPEEVKQAIITHAQMFVATKSEKAFPQLRKHLAWYVSNFLPNSSKLRSQLVQVNSIAEVLAALQVQPQ